MESGDQTTRPAWPAGCPKLSSCARNRMCMYGCATHRDREIAGEVDAETARRQAEQQTTERPLICEACQAEAPMGSAGWLVTADHCDVCPECAPDLWAEWTALSEDERERYA